jgi:two-component system, OmpR family, response regulator RstA
MENPDMSPPTDSEFATHESPILLFKVCHRATPHLRAALCEQGFRVWTCHSSHQLQAGLARRRWSLVLLDFPQPVGGAAEICLRVRKLFDGPVVVVSSPVDEATQLRVLRTGVDALIEWPISVQLLGARLQTLIQRSAPSLATSTRVEAPFQTGGLAIDPARREVRYENRRIELTDLEFDLLNLLARNTGAPVSRDTLYEELRGLPYDGQDRSMDLRISRLRRKLEGDDPAEKLILTVRGTGYQLAAGLL